MKVRKTRKRKNPTLGVMLANPPRKRRKTRKRRRNPVMASRGRDPKFLYVNAGKRAVVQRSQTRPQDIKIILPDQPSRKVRRRAAVSPRTRTATSGPRRPKRHLPARRPTIGTPPPFPPPSAQQRQNPLFGNPSGQTVMALGFGLLALVGMGFALPWLKAKALGLFKQPVAGPDGKPTLISNLAGIVAAGAAVVVAERIPDERRRVAVQLGLVAPVLVPLAKQALDTVKPGLSASFLGDSQVPATPLRFDFEIGPGLRGGLAQDLDDLSSNATVDAGLTDAANGEPPDISGENGEDILMFGQNDDPLLLGQGDDPLMFGGLMGDEPLMFGNADDEEQMPVLVN